MFEVFICATGNDYSFADNLKGKLDEAHINVFNRKIEFSHEKRCLREIMRAITEAKVFIFLLSSSSNDDESLMIELEKALDLSKIFITIKIDNVIPKDELSYYIGSTQWIDASVEDEHSKAVTLLSGVLFKILNQKNATSHDVETTYHSMQIERLRKEKNNDETKFRYLITNKPKLKKVNNYANKNKNAFKVTKLLTNIWSIPIIVFLLIMYWVFLHESIVNFISPIDNDVMIVIKDEGPNKVVNEKNGRRNDNKFRDVSNLNALKNNKSQRAAKKIANLKEINHEYSKRVTYDNLPLVNDETNFGWEDFLKECNKNELYDIYSALLKLCNAFQSGQLLKLDKNKNMDVGTFVISIIDNQKIFSRESYELFKNGKNIWNFSPWQTNNFIVRDNNSYYLFQTDDSAKSIHFELKRKITKKAVAQLNELMNKVMNSTVDSISPDLYVLNLIYFNKEIRLEVAHSEQGFSFYFFLSEITDGAYMYVLKEKGIVKLDVRGKKIIDDLNMSESDLLKIEKIIIRQHKNFLYLWHKNLAKE